LLFSLSSLFSLPLSLPLRTGPSSPDGLFPLSSSFSSC
jgi:hypothetical protein